MKTKHEHMKSYEPAFPRRTSPPPEPPTGKVACADCERDYDAGRTRCPCCYSYLRKPTP